MSCSRNENSQPTRLLPERPLPPYSYVTGKFPHPTRDASGHAYGVAEPAVSIAEADRWRECETYLWGIDLFNSGYYWEAHESWEAVWHAAGRRGPVAQFCKSLIKLAAAGVKAREGRAKGVQKHVERAKDLLAALLAELGSDQSRDMGLALGPLIDCAQRLIDNPSAVIDISDEPVVVVMPFHLEVVLELD